MKGAWAGEIGQTQFVPTYYADFAVDYDGDGKRNLVRSVPDVLASSANLLKHHGWQAGQPWLEEVRVPAEMPWAEADLAIKHPRSAWASFGVTKADGGALPADGMQASLLLPMGRLGPAFLAYPNFDVYTQWNQSLVYATTAAYFATRLAGAPACAQGTARSAEPRTGAGSAAAPEEARLRRRRRRRRHRRADARRGEGRAAEARPAGRFLSRPDLPRGAPADVRPVVSLPELALRDIVAGLR